MRYAEAFTKLNYDLRLPRQHWSAVSDQGVCISLWRVEIDWKNRKFDSREDANPPDTWNAAGANKRKEHLKTAVQEFGGWVDVVVVDGIPGEGVDKATPWNPAERENLLWRVTFFDEAMGHFRAEMMPADERPR